MARADGPASQRASASSGAQTTDTATMAWGRSRSTEGRNFERYCSSAWSSWSGAKW